MAKTTKKAPKIEEAQIIEEVKTEKVTAELLPTITEEVINQNLIKLNIVEVSIQELKDQYLPVKFTTVEDEVNNEFIKKGYKELVSYRTGIDGKRKELNKPFQDVIDTLNSEAKRITAELSPIEKHLKTQKDLLDAALKEDEERKEREAKERLDKRVDELKIAGLEFDGNFYSCGNISMDIQSIAKLSEEDYEIFKSKVEFEKNRVEKEIFEYRLNKLNEIGFTPIEGGYILQDVINISEQDLKNYSVDDFEKWFGGIAQELVKIEKEKAAKALEAQQNEILEERAEILDLLGFDLKNEIFVYSEHNITITYTAQQVKQMTAPEWKDVRAEVKDKIKAAKSAPAPEIEKPEVKTVPEVKETEKHQPAPEVAAEQPAPEVNEKIKLIEILNYINGYLDNVAEIVNKEIKDDQLKAIYNEFDKVIKGKCTGFINHLKK